MWLWILAVLYLLFSESKEFQSLALFLAGWGLVGLPMTLFGVLMVKFFEKPLETTLLLGLCVCTCMAVDRLYVPPWVSESGATAQCSPRIPANCSLDDPFWCVHYPQLQQAVPEIPWIREPVQGPD